MSIPNWVKQWRHDGWASMGAIRRNPTQLQAIRDGLADALADADALLATSPANLDAPAAVALEDALRHKVPSILGL